MHASHQDFLFILGLWRLSFSWLCHYGSLCCWKQDSQSCELVPHSHTTLARLGSRRGFAFALIGCVIWDTRSRLKPCEDRKESLGSIRTGDGSQDIVLISKILKCLWFLPKCLWYNSVFLLVFIQVTEDEWSKDRHRQNCKGHMLLLFFFGYRLSPPDD